MPVKSKILKVKTDVYILSCLINESVRLNTDFYE